MESRGLPSSAFCFSRHWESLPARRGHKPPQGCAQALPKGRNTAPQRRTPRARSRPPPRGAEDTRADEPLAKRWGEMGGAEQRPLSAQECEGRQRSAKGRGRSARKRGPRDRKGAKGQGGNKIIQNENFAGAKQFFRAGQE